MSVCHLKQFVADADLASGSPYMPECSPPTGKKVAIIGAGPTGLTAAYYLLQLGHAVVLIDDQPQAGGRLWRETSAEELPRDILTAETGLILRLGLLYRPCTHVGRDISFEDIRHTADAVLVACGAIDKAGIQELGLAAGRQGIEANRETFETALPGRLRRRQRPPRPRPGRAQCW